MADNVISFPTPDERDHRDGRSNEVPAEEHRLPVREVIGDVLREERHEQERTLADVAEDAAVSLPYLSEIERGRKEVSSDLLQAVCDALEVSVADVLERAADRLRVGRLGSSGGFDAQLLAA